MSSFVGRFTLLISILLGGVVEAANEQLQIITATGRAVISQSGALNEAKNSALEDALYMAALSGGAKIDGFSSVQADTSLDDHFVVRPSSEILDYDIIDEVYDDLHYQVTIQAAVGSIEQSGCQNRKLGHISMFAPSYNLTRQVPGWLSTTPQLMVQSLYNQMAVKPEFTLTNHAGTKLDVTDLQKNTLYDYAVLTASQPKIADGDFAFTTDVTFATSRSTNALHQQQFLDVHVTSWIFTGSKYDMLGDLTHSLRIEIGSASISQTISTLMTPRRSDIHADLFQLVDTHAEALSKLVLCMPLSAAMTAHEDGMRVTIGARQGLGVNDLAMVSGKMTPWTVLRVTKVDANRATLVPLNRQRKLTELNGQNVTFLEFD